MIKPELSFRYPALAPVLIVVSLVSVVAIVWLASDAIALSGLSGAMQETSAASEQYPWIKAAMVDFSLMTTFVSLWIINREPLAKAIPLVALLWVFGCALVGAYMLYEYFTRQRD